MASWIEISSIDDRFGYVARVSNEVPVRVAGDIALALDASVEGESWIGLEPLKVAVFPDGRRVLIAGHSRLIVAERRGWKKVFAEVSAMTYGTAVWAAAAENCHGTSSSGKDRRLAVERILCDSKLSELGNKEIASQCFVTARFVLNVRKELSGELEKPISRGGAGRKSSENSKAKAGTRSKKSEGVVAEPARNGSDSASSVVDQCDQDVPAVVVSSPVSMVVSTAVSETVSVPVVDRTVPGNPLLSVVRMIDDLLVGDRADINARMLIEHILGKVPNACDVGTVVTASDGLSDEDIVVAVDLIREQRSEVFPESEVVDSSFAVVDPFLAENPKTPEEAFAVCQLIRDSLPKGKREFDARMKQKYYGSAVLSSRVKPDVYLPHLPQTGDALLCLIYEMRHRRLELMAVDRKHFKDIKHKNLALDLVAELHKAADLMQRHFDPSLSQASLFSNMPDSLNTPEFNEAWTARKEILVKKGSNINETWEVLTLGKLEKIGVKKALEAVLEANLKGHWKLKYVDYVPETFGGNRSRSKVDDGSNGFGPSIDAELMKMIRGDYADLRETYREGESFLRARAFERERLGLPDDRPGVMC